MVRNTHIAMGGKRGHIDPTLQTLLAGLKLTAAQWIATSLAFRQYDRNGDLRLKQTA